MELARVKNNRPTFLSLPAIQEDISTEREPNRFRDIFPSLRLDPDSEHNVSDEYIQALTELPEAHCFHMWHEAGYFTITRPTDHGHAVAIAKPEGVTAPKSLAGYPDEMAQALIRAEESKAVLRTWLKAEADKGRRGIVEALKAKLAE